MQSLAIVLGVVALIFIATEYLGVNVLGPSEKVKAVARAISIAEGFGVQGAIPTLANNPGDITDVGQKLSGDTGQRLGRANIIVFDTVEHGWDALHSQVARMLSGNDPLYPASFTLVQTGAQYAADAVLWPANVASQLNVSIDTTLGEIAQT